MATYCRNCRNMEGEISGIVTATGALFPRTPKKIGKRSKKEKFQVSQQLQERFLLKAQETFG